jgi:hypothetical protein
VGLASADIDGDGKRDLMVANEGSEGVPGSVSVLKGQGNGTFILQQQPNPDPEEPPLQGATAELGTRAVAVGNIDANPGLEALAVNRRSDSVSVFTIDQDCILTLSANLPAGAEPSDLALADLNNDGKLDLIVVNTNDDAVTVQFGNGDRTFGTAQSYPVGTAPTRLVVGQLNNDTLLDLAVANSRSGNVSILLATAPGVFAPARTFVADAEPRALALGDFNQDGLLDPVTVTEGSDRGSSVVILRNRGAGSLHAGEDLPSGIGPTAVAVADLDDDGIADLLIGGDSGQAQIFAGGANGFAPPQVLNFGGRTPGVAAADLNGDARPDIVVTDTMASRVGISLSEGGGAFAAATFYTTAEGPGGVTIGDFNGDGRPDVAVSAVQLARVCMGGPQPGQSCRNDNECAPGGICSAPGSASVLLQQANGSFGPARNTAVDETPIGIAALNSNCDGRDDLIVANFASPSAPVMALRSNGDGTFAIAQTLGISQVGQNPIAVAVADFDRDGVDDFAVANTVAPGASANVHLFKGNCSGPYAAFPPPAVSQIRVGELANALVARDFTGDQRVDLAVSSQTSNELCLLLGSGTGSLSRIGFGSCDRVSRMPTAITAGDFDADGRYDAASANNDASANNVTVLSNCVRDLGCNPFAPLPSETPLPGAPALRGDANGDDVQSAADLVAVAAEVMDGDGFRVEAIDNGDFQAAPGADANGDGRVDAQDRVAVAHRIFSGA